MARENGFLQLVVLPLLIGVLRIVPTSVESIGICYGTNGDNLPPASEVVSLYKTYGIDAMRIYEPNEDILTALKGSRISLMMGVDPSLLADAAAATAWVKNNILAYPDVSFKYIVVGNEVNNNVNQILPAMSKLWDALCAKNLGGRIKVSTAVQSNVTKDTYPPSNAQFSVPYMFPIVTFLAKTGNPLLVNIYPYFAHQDHPDVIALDYALFTAPGTVFTDKNTKYQYQNLFDAMVDSVYYALEKAGGKSVKVVVSESGWPSVGNAPAGTTPENAQMYNQRLIGHVATGTPKRKGNLETYIFAMFNENKKPGADVERHFGLFDGPSRKPLYRITFK